MLTQPDTQDFTRFLLSVGALLCIAAVLVPALVLRETSVLRVSAAELSELTPVARGELERRQRVARDVGRVAPLAGVGLFAGGLALVLLAVPRLRRQERAREAREAVEFEHLRAQLEQQTEGEQQVRQVQEAQEVLAAEQAQEREVPPEPEPAAGREPPATGMPTDAEMARYRSKVETSEHAVLARLAEVAPKGYALETNVRFGNAALPLLLDALYVSRDRTGFDVVIEVKYSGRTTPRTVHNAVRQLLGQVQLYRERFDRRAVGWLIVVAEDSVREVDLARATSLAGIAKGGPAVSGVRVGEVGKLAVPLKDLRRFAAAG